MIVFALECSAPCASAALLRDDEILATREWPPGKDAHARQGLFADLPALLADAGVSWEQVDLFAAGRGPGIYSGMRLAITAVHALALPGRQKTFFLSSGEALARDIHLETGVSHVLVAGDARRDEFWRGVFQYDNGRLVERSDWTLARWDRLAEDLPAGTVAVTSEWERLAPLTVANPLPNLRWLEAPRYPSATAIARRAAEMFAAGLPSEPALPIYMHAAVR